MIPELVVAIAAIILVVLGYHWLGPVFLVLVGLALLAALFARCTVFSRLQVRRMRWRTLLWIRPGPGFATIVELWWRWGRIAAIRYGKRTRPAVPLRWRLITRSTAFATRMGRGPYFRRCYVSNEHQKLWIAPPRKGKTGQLGDQVIDHPGAALVHETRLDMLTGTAGWRKKRHPHGRIDTFNPDGLGGIPSTFRWAMTLGCDDPAEALYRAADLVGAIADIGEMQWWAEKARGALAAAVHAAGLTSDNPAAKAAAAVAAGMHAANLIGADMSDVWAWSYGGGQNLIREAQRHPLASEPLLGALTELERPGKTADSIRITMTKSLAWLAVPALRDMVTGPAAGPFDVPRWLDTCGTIYMISPGGEDAPAAPLFRCFTGYVHRQARTHAQLLPGRRLDPGPLFALDELDKCPVNLPGWMADSGGAGIQISAVVHSTGQLKDKYGDAGLDTVWSTAGVKIFLGGNHHVHTLNDVSALVGQLPGGEGRGLNPCAPIEYLARLPRWRALIINDDLTPTVVKIRPYWKRTAVRLGFAPAMPMFAAPTAARQASVPESGRNGHGAVRSTAPFPADAATADGGGT